MTEPIAPCMKCEFVIVVGAEDLYSGADRHNKLMFAQSGIRYTKSWGPKFDRTTVFMFNGLCCTNRVMAEVPLSPDGLIPRPL